jgi:hypothetical protein
MSMVNSIALLIVLSSVNAQQIRGLADDCPQGYLSREGDVPGYGTEIKGKQNANVVTDCSSKCDIDPNCCSFEWSPTEKLCNLNRTCEPTEAKYKDYYFCTKARCPECVSDLWTYPDSAEKYDGCANPDDDDDGDWCPTYLENGEYVAGSGKFKRCGDCAGQLSQDSQPTCPTGYTKCSPTVEYPEGCCDFDSDCLCDEICELDHNMCSFSINNCDKICEASAKDGKDGCENKKLPNGSKCTADFRNGWDRCNYRPGSGLTFAKWKYQIKSICTTEVR